MSHHQVPDMERMSVPFPSSERYSTLTAREYSRLQMLNEELKRAEHWITQRGKDMVLSYSLAVAQERHAADGRLDEDVELIATLVFLARDDQPPFATRDNRIVAQIDIPILSKFDRNGNSSLSGIHTKISDARHNNPWSQLLLDLYGRALRQDMSKLLSIGSLCIDVMLIRQQLRSW
ncbi:hypothetical protein [Burkholderia sp. Ac-20353]|uniref:hypothetical protein n=1 Tax=Burkholderia sp. Ac-20353 TaxID=2703894 RepID=UPI00197C2F17|nr:hypothetical protein [Burkholderia sp. Ac-20353]MBN3786584.1 hypothetical protein [Burkholderia sp. Ac-20353]